MRWLLLLFTLLVPGFAFAAGWERYENARGYAIEVPPGFDWGREADNGDGRAFRDGASKLSVWGGAIVEASFEDAVQAARGAAAAEGWGITYEVVTPDWASYSGLMGNRVLYRRMIALCGGTEYAAFELQYSTIDMAKLQPTVERLVASLRASNNGC